MALSIDTLISTMHKESHAALLKDMNISQGAVVINQVTKKRAKPDNVVDDKNGIVFKSFLEKGLSRSRNRALAVSAADICVIADDDMTYVDGYADIVRQAYDKYPNADIIIFRIDNSDGTKRELPEGRLGWALAMKVCSVQITFRTKSIKSTGMLFDERFGAGTDNFMGEENIFLNQCIKANLAVYSYPVKIATLQDTVTTGTRNLNPHYFQVRGKVFRRIAPRLAFILILRFAILKRGLYRGNVSILQAIRHMVRGYISGGIG